MRKIQSIQAMRGFAAFAVVVCHAAGWSLGAAGVDVFFVISGFIIGHVMKRRSPGQFLVDRAWRIYPIYYVALIPWIFVAVLSGFSDPARWASTLTLWPVYAEYARPLLFPAWSLCYEILFYATVAFGLATRMWRLILAAYAIAFGLSFVTDSALLAFVGNPLILEFLIGLGLTRVRTDARIGTAALGVGALWFLLSPAAALYALPIDTAGFPAFERVLWWGIPAACLVYGALSLEKLFSGFVVRLGDASYSLYLVHMTVIIGSPFPPIATIGLCVFFGFALHYYVERPLLRLRKSSREAQTPSPIAAPAT